MKNSLFKIQRFNAFKIARLILILLAGILSLPISANAKSVKPDNVDYYTCTMHPSVRSQDPDGHCPICDMNLVPVYKKSAITNLPTNSNSNSTAVGTRKIKFYQSTMNPRETSSTPAKDSMGMEMKPVYAEANDPESATNDFFVPVKRQQQIGVTYATVEKRPLRLSLRTVGTVAFDPERHWDYVAAVDGYVRQLSVFSRGDWVKKNSPLMSLYSPDLLTSENELVDLLKTRDAARAQNQTALLASTKQLIDATEQRLRLWNITDAQIAKLETSRQPTETLTLESPFQGVVQNLTVNQGSHVSVGDHLVSVDDLSTVWIWAQFYQNELSFLKTGLPVSISVSSYPNEKFSGKISLIDPFINNETRTARARIEVKNAGFKLRPDMYVNVELNLNSGEGLTVPVAAVLPTGTRNLVFVDQGGGHLAARFVELGQKYGDFYEVKSGLRENKRVVDSANFLIDAEAQIQGAVKSW